MDNKIEIKEDYFSNEEENNNTVSINKITESNNTTNNNTNNSNNNNNNNIESTISTNPLIESNSNNTNNNTDIINIENLKAETIKLNYPEELHTLKDLENKKAIELLHKTKRNKDLKFDTFFKKNRHYLIMTDGGKPVYSRYGDEIENSTIFATLSAIVTKFSCFVQNGENKEELNVISNEKSKMVFLKKGQLIFIALSKKNDNTSLLITQLEFLYQQLMSILTIHFYEKLEDNPSKCLTAMSDTEILFEQMIQYTNKSMVSILNSFQVMPFENREQLNKICEINRGDALLCIVMTSTQILAISYNTQISLVPTDIVLIQNLIFSWESLRTTESWVPICLPGISEDGYLQLYCKFTEENIGVCFLTENMDSEFFMKFMNQNNQIYDSLLQQNLLEKILKSIPVKKENEIEKKLIENSSENNQEIINLLLNKILKNNNSKTKKNSLSPFSDLNRKTTFFSNNINNNINNNNDNNDNNNNNNNNNKNNINNTPNVSKSINRNYTIFSTTNNEKNENDIFENVIYGLCKNKKLNQFFLINSFLILFAKLLFSKFSFI